MKLLLTSKNTLFCKVLGQRIIPPAPPGWDNWEELMRLALSEGEKARVAGEVPVGALIVNATGKIISSAHNLCVAQSDPCAHAEILALRRAGKALGNYRLDGAYLVVTLEPCMMCAGALVHARLAGLVYGARDQKAGAVESCLEGLEQYFHNHRVWHLGGILENECAAQLQSFFSAAR